MTTYLDTSFDKRVSRIEEQIKQLKATQDYGLAQVQYYTSNSISTNSIAWWEPNYSMNIYGVHAIVEFQGYYTNKRAVANIYPWFTNTTDSGIILWTSSIQGGTFNDNVVRFDLWGQSLRVPTDPGQTPRSYSFTLNAKVVANMEGNLKIISTETIQGAYSDA